jgi:hypothetical protein
MRVARGFIIQHITDGRGQPIRFEHDKVAQSWVVLVVDEMPEAVRDVMKMLVCSSSILCLRQSLITSSNGR